LLISSETCEICLARDPEGAYLACVRLSLYLSSGGWDRTSDTRLMKPASRASQIASNPLQNLSLPRRGITCELVRGLAKTCEKQRKFRIVGGKCGKNAEGSAPSPSAVEREVPAIPDDQGRLVPAVLNAEQEGMHDGWIALFDYLAGVLECGPWPPDISEVLSRRRGKLRHELGLNLFKNFVRQIPGFVFRAGPLSELDAVFLR
jgi:hypothetical protein